MKESDEIKKGDHLGLGNDNEGCPIREFTECIFLKDYSEI